MTSARIFYREKARYYNLSSQFTGIPIVPMDRALTVHLGTYYLKFQIIFFKVIVHTRWGKSADGLLVSTTGDGGDAASTGLTVCTWALTTQSIKLFF